ncbi:hypothetical protein BKP45_05100 [Anaerobacillus alkalidiazotrophicus]|uniref:Uncharacterized protein n=1 Tax=Anaerobacillus alkalidiazotrophicus TaxID=472963 RepID=A0A1S2MCP2_9BACI|nr:hypothetical protein [Anaerobacillus alkalidiazotrophicus]OIJ22501.1 hypothetical protein BKP45_05100 [Anaerobacillus alkalidiazotrophicus]
MQNTDADKLQSVISDDLFPQVQHISDVKQVLEEMKTNAQELQPYQIRAILFLKELGKNEYLHLDGDPYKEIQKFVMEGKVLVSDPAYYLDTIEALIPKPPKPIVMAEKIPGGKK